MSQFIYLLNAFEQASQSDNPSLLDYARKRKALLEHVEKLESARPEVGKLTDEQIMNAACTAADTLDATRVSEMRAGGWHATTIFDGDSGLLRFGRLIEQALRSPLARSQEKS